ncbi:MAG: HEAT repeat domain-containing protein [Candidatus Hydrogenedentes bacterium]|nr:HEAT repeat domain-containing protein [Candidatus Hydrogenedentota bacterium]
MDAIHALMGEPDSQDSGEAAWNQVLPLREQLGKSGPEAVPAIVSRIENEPNTRTRAVFVYALGMIPGEEVDRFLLRLFCFDRTAGHVAGFQLVWRTEHFGPFTFRVPDEQMEAMLDMVRDRPAMGAGDPMRILGKCHGNEQAPIAKTVLERFLKEVKAPDDLAPVGVSYLSPRTSMLNKFLLAFGHMPEGMVPLLREAHVTAEREGDRELAKWLLMALGFCGDGGAGDALREIVLHDTDRYVRCLAIRAYRRAAGVKAVPVLRPLLEDTTETEYHADFPPARLIIQNTARAMLMSILRESFGEKEISYEKFEALLDAVERGETPPK